MNDGTVSPVGGERRLDVQGLRAVAVLMVVVYHAWPDGLAGGFVGVDVFFVISGYVITRMLRREHEATGRIDLRGFYARRIRRILPALAVTLGVAAIGCWLILDLNPAAKATARTGTAAATLWANIQLWAAPGGYFDVPTESNALLHTWSLSVEEQFYLVFPLLMIGAWKLRRPGLALGGVGVASFALATLTVGSFAFYWTPARAWEFLVGAGLVFAPRLTVSDLAARTIGAVGGLAILAASLLYTSWTPFPGPTALLPVGGAAAVIWAGGHTTGWVTGLLAARPMVRIGDMSYGWYLWHWPAIVFSREIAPVWVPVAAVGSLGVAWLTEQLVENPVRYQPRLVGRRVVALAAACVLVPAVAAGGVVQASADVPTQGGGGGLWHLDGRRGCFSPKRLAEKPPGCTFLADSSRGRIVLVGDSNAGHFSEPVVAAGNQLGFDVTLATMPGCRFALTTMAGHPRLDTEGCARFVPDTIDDLLADPPDLVVVGNSGWVLEHHGFIDPATGEMVADDRRSDAWRDAMIAALQPLTDADIRVLLVHQVPHLDGPRDAIHAVEEAVADHLRLATLDLADAVCEGGCPTAPGDRYGDEWHLTVRFAETLTPRFSEAFTAVLSDSI